MMRFLVLSLPICLLTSAVVSKANADDLRGAREVLKAAYVEPIPLKKSSGKIAGDLDAALKTFSEARASAMPQEQVAGWLKVFDLLDAVMPEPESRVGMRVVYSADGEHRFQQLFKVLPGPSAWEELAAKARERTLPEDDRLKTRELSLRLLTDVLTGDSAQYDKDWTALDEHTKSPNFNDSSDWFLNVTFPRDDRPVRARVLMLRPWNDEETRKSAIAESFEAELQDPNGDPNVPVLVPLLGKDRARPLLEKALRRRSNHVKFCDGFNNSCTTDLKTVELAREVALNMIDKLRYAPWDLAQSPDAVAFYEALVKKFGEPLENDDLQQNATVFYVLGLAKQGRLKDAEAMLKRCLAHDESAGDDASPQFECDFDLVEFLKAEPGLADSFWKVLHTVVMEDPKMPQILFYMQLGVELKKIDDVQALETLFKEQPELAEFRGIAKWVSTKALVLDGQFEAAATIYREAIAGEAENHAKGEAVSGEPGVLLARLGRKIDKREWIEEGLNSAVLSISDQYSDESYISAGEYSSSEDFSTEDFIDLLIENGRYADAEKLLQIALKEESKEVPGEHIIYFSSHSDTLEKLVLLYHRQKRYEDVLLLLDEAKWWRVDDLGQTVSDWYTRGSGPALNEAVADSLIQLGQPKRALPILNRMLATHRRDDDPYRLLAQVDPEKALQKCDELAKYDPGEERPLIWRAKILLEQGEIEAAEKAIQKAIRLSPPQAEQGRTSRILPSEVFAEILEKAGKSDEAKQHRNAAAAIRLAQQADRLASARRNEEGIQKYQEALKLLPDSWSIHWRLASTLLAADKKDEASAHYQQTFELMPDLAGTIAWDDESSNDCSDCEIHFAGLLSDYNSERASVFGDKEIEKIAERVFAQRVKEKPYDPRAHFLLGYLRMEQDRSKEALVEFETVVALAPNHYSAWEYIADITSRLAGKTEQNNNALFALLQLSPAYLEENPDFSSVSDARGLWNAFERANRLAPERPVATYPLKASAEFNEVQRRAEEKRDGISMRTTFFEQKERLSIHDALLRNDRIKELAALIHRQ